MPPEGNDLGSPQDWLARARSNLSLARTLKTEDILWEDLCFQLQQAVEKSIKGVLLHCGVIFPYVHNISQLITLLKTSGIPWLEELDAAADLTEYAVEMRYPGFPEEAVEEDYRQALAIAERVVAWAETIITEANSATAQSPETGES